MSENIIEINSLTKTYGKRRGIEDISFSVKKGEIFGFIGPNGAGKSTTIRTLLALMHPTSGSASIFSKDCIREAPAIAKDIGYLPSETSYYEQMTVEELLDYAAALYDKDCKDRITELSKRLQLDLKRKISELSLGNKKKVGIVQALLHSPRLLILDEPTNGLDPLVQHTFFEILQEENKKGTTIFFSSHVLSEVQKICDRVAIIKEGKIINLQKIHELNENGYKKIELIAKVEIPNNYFNLVGIMDYKQDANRASFMYKGEVGNILEKIWRLQVSDVSIEEPALEDIFMHYYN
ncbi:ABC-2 type transport system ATP-binding protein [Seinonella peptonophila]|uniref:ABC-2 type transport system ATP-binding protein n=1 Tax=Seinonella peptonophila TaxID=112248 RepID=A0A1M4T884_9BACL|nr:ABC transporter ATP-binding protein [Seinonella peptonophila]SHE40620.1 ABC-2 type transport system ATP-binding protein [Seinonella peptonophila]